MEEDLFSSFSYSAPSAITTTTATENNSNDVSADRSSKEASSAASTAKHNNNDDDDDDNDDTAIQNNGDVEIIINNGSSNNDGGIHVNNKDGHDNNNNNNDNNNELLSEQIMEQHDPPEPPPQQMDESKLLDDDDEDEQEQSQLPKIKPISESSIKRIVAGQAVSDLSSAVKELVDNAIDARATRVNVRLHNQGLDVIEVSDNGTGVPKSSRPFIAMKHATSKLACFEDLYRGGNCNSNNNSNSNNNYEHDNGGDDDNGGDALHKTNNDKATTIDDPTYAAAPTLGFRGEALFCLANLSRSMVVSTRCNFDNHNHNHSGDDTNNIDAGDGDDNGISNSSNTSSGLGEQFAFDHEGHLIPESVQAFARPVGTTVTVNGLFETLPVRRVDLIKRIKGQRMKLMKMLQGYAILCLGTQFNLIDVITANSQSKKKPKSEVRLATSESSNSLEERTASVLGTKFLSGLTRIIVDLHQAVEQPNSTNTDSDSDPVAPPSPPLRKTFRWKMEGLVSHAPTAPQPTTARELQFFSINGRPVDLPTVSRVLGDVWRQFDPSLAAGGRRRPACILAFTLPNNMYDVNLSPDKREVIFTEEVAISNSIREALTELWSTESNGKFAANEVENRSNEAKGSAKKETGVNEVVEVYTGSLTMAESDTKKDENRVDPEVNFGQNEEFETITPRLSRKKTKREHDSDITGNLDSNAPAAITPHEVDSPTDEADVENVSKEQSRSMIGNEELSPSAKEKPVQFEDSTLIDESGAIQPEEVTPTPRDRPKQHERRTWEQMRLSFKRIENSQLQQDIQRVLSSDHDNTEDEVDNTAQNVVASEERSLIKSRATSLKKYVTNDLPTRKTARKESFTSHRQSNRPKRNAPDVGSFLDNFAFGSSNNPEKDQADDNDEPENDSEDDDETPLVYRIEKERHGRSSWKENGVSNVIRGNNGRMIVGRTVKAGKRSVALKRKTYTEESEEETEDTPSYSGSNLNHLENSLSTDSVEEFTPNQTSTKSNESSVGTVWNSFAGTQDIIAQYQHARRDMHKNRKLLHSSLKRKRSDCNNDCTAKEEEKKSKEEPTVSLVKEDFLHMSIIGQFNLGFVLARCRNHNLWILDQHACDERFNFERFCKETVIHEQKLIAPLPLELSPSEENCVLEHMDVFEQNGFRLAYDPEKEPRHRLSLTALPHSGSGGDGKKAVQFGKEDVGALCAMLGADGTSSSDGYNAGLGSGADGSGLVGNNAVRRYAGTAGSSQVEQKRSKSSGIAGSSIARLPKAIAMFANRACRGSIMIGTALSHKEQINVVEKLHKVDIPWNCPHGRPTLSHVRSLVESMVDDDNALAAHVSGPSLSVLCDV